MGSKLFQGIQALGKSGLCFCTSCKAGSLPLQSGLLQGTTGHLNGARLSGAMKMAKSCNEGTAASEEDMGWKVSDLKLGAKNE